MDVTATDTAGLDPNQDILRSDIWFWHVLVLKVIARLQHQRLHSKNLLLPVSSESLKTIENLQPKDTTK
jgi:hypothetical protein